MNLPQLACVTLLLSSATTACSLPGEPTADCLPNFSTPTLASTAEAAAKQPKQRCSSEHEFGDQQDQSALSPTSFALGTTKAAGFWLDEDAETAIQSSGRIAVPKWKLKPSSKELAQRAGQFRVAQGWFLSLGAAYADFSDEHLNGNLLLVGTDTIVLAEPDPGFGGAVSLGYRFDKMAFEFVYLQTEHDATHVFPAAGTAYDVTFKSFALNLRHYFNRKSRFQPFLNFGIASTQFIIENGASLGLAVDDATLEDNLSLNVGIGCSMYYTNRLSLNLLVEYRDRNNYREAEGVTPKGGTQEVNGEGFNAVLSLAYIF